MTGSALFAVLGIPAPARAQSDAVRIGHLAPRSGPFASRGDYGVMGIELAVEEINAAGGIAGRKIELLLADSADPKIAAEKAGRMITRDKVAALIGAVSPAAGATIEAAAKSAAICFIGTAPAAASRIAAAMPRRYVEIFAKRFGKLPQSQSWVDYCALKRAARSLAGTESIDPAGCSDAIVPPANACVK